MDFKGSNIEDDPQPKSDDNKPDSDEPGTMIKVDVMEVETMKKTEDLKEGAGGR